jgi:hypothetical protein
VQHRSRSVKSAILGKSYRNLRQSTICFIKHGQFWLRHRSICSVRGNVSNCESATRNVGLSKKSVKQFRTYKEKGRNRESLTSEGCGSAGDIE